MKRNGGALPYLWRKIRANVEEFHVKIVIVLRVNLSGTDHKGGMLKQVLDGRSPSADGAGRWEIHACRDLT